MIALMFFGVGLCLAAGFEAIYAGMCAVVRAIGFSKHGWCYWIAVYVLGATTGLFRFVHSELLMAISPM